MKAGSQKEVNRHTLIMALCCLMPLAILAALWMIGVSGSYLVLGLILLCPLLVMPSTAFVDDARHARRGQGMDIGFAGMTRT
jgi:hypothetical protein